MTSVIIPIYNQEKWLSQCIESVLAQDNHDIEVILVNDGSTDNSGVICDIYAKKDGRIQVIHKRNEGVDKARFSGLSLAQGEYVVFLDSDDWIENNMLGIMCKAMKTYDVDYVEVGLRRVMDKMRLIRKKALSPVLGLIDQPSLFDDYFISFMGVNVLSVNMCGKMYKRNVIDSAMLEPSGLCMGEDLYFNMMLFPYLKKVFIMDYIGYNYRYGGMTTKYNPNLFPDLKYLYKIKKELIRKYSYYKANDYIIYEIVNVLKSNVRQKILFNSSGKDAIIEDLNRELDDPLWGDIWNISNKAYLDKMIPKAILEKDATCIYNHCKCIVDSQKLRWNVKRFVSKLMSDYL